MFKSWDNKFGITAQGNTSNNNICNFLASFNVVLMLLKRENMQNLPIWPNKNVQIQYGENAS